PFPLLPLRAGVLFPGTVLTLPVGRERSIALARELRRGDVVGVATQKDPAVTDPGFADLHPIGTFVRVVDVTRMQSGDFRIALEGVGRMNVTALPRHDPFWLAEGEVLADKGGDTDDAKLFAQALHEQVRELAKGGGALSQVGEVDDDPGGFADKVAASLGMPPDKERRVIEALDVTERLRLVAGFLMEAKPMSDLNRKIH